MDQHRYLMSTTLELVTDLIRLSQGGTHALEPTYSAGVSDGLGERLIFFTDPGATSLELLRFRPDLGDAPGFEEAVRASVEALGLLDPSLATVRAVERIEELNGLALVSVRQSGRRLSEMMPRASGMAFAVELVREIGPALALLHEAGHAHGALTAERIMVSREGRLIVLEHVLGAALGTLALPAAGLRGVAGIAVPQGDGPARINARLDVLQLGFIALSLTSGQPLAPSDYPRRVGPLLDQFSTTSPEAAAAFRPWLERALQVGGRPFANASEALAAFGELPQGFSTTAGDVPTAWPALPAVDGAKEPPAPEARFAEAPIDLGAASGPYMEAADAPAAGGIFARLVPPAFSSTRAGLRKVAAALGAVVILQSLIIAYLVLKGGSTDLSARASSPSAWTEVPSDPGLEVTDPSLDGAPTDPAGTSATEPNAEPARMPTSESASVTARVSQSADPPPPAPTEVSLTPASAEAVPAPAVTPPPVPAEPGSVEVRSPIELQVFEGGTRLGSTAGLVPVTAGSHTLDVVNEELGFRDRYTVSVSAGEAVSITIAIPTGRIDINAVPWADVWIDGVATGQTPLANLSLPIGRHEVVFRHPQLGERRETAIVKVDGIARVSAVFQR
jgi:hypothetical protein